MILKKIETLDDLKPGMVVRELYDDGEPPPFGDSLVIDVTSEKATLVRPYGALAGVSSWFPSPETLTGTETRELTLAELTSYRIVTNDKGLPFKFTV